MDPDAVGDLDIEGDDDSAVDAEVLFGAALAASTMKTKDMTDAQRNFLKMTQEEVTGKLITARKPSQIPKSDSSKLLYTQPTLMESICDPKGYNARIPSAVFMRTLFHHYVLNKELPQYNKLRSMLEFQFGRHDHHHKVTKTIRRYVSPSSTAEDGPTGKTKERVHAGLVFFVTEFDKIVAWNFVPDLSQASLAPLFQDLRDTQGQVLQSNVKHWFTDRCCQDRQMIHREMSKEVAVLLDLRHFFFRFEDALPKVHVARDLFLRDLRKTVTFKEHHGKVQRSYFFPPDTLVANLEGLMNRYRPYENPPLITPAVESCFLEQLTHVRKGCLGYNGPATVRNCRGEEISVQGTREGVHFQVNREAGTGSSSATRSETLGWALTQHFVYRYTFQQ
ncbi:hypothetical protein HDU93_007060, partial [Gonapodya sp. JEL0774]